MTAPSATPATLALGNLLARQACNSRAEDHINRAFRHNSRKNWYGDALKTEGLSVAESQLAEWARRSHHYVYASCINPIAHGMLALGMVQPDSLVDITACSTNVHTSISDRHGLRRKFIMFNAQAPGRGCMQPAGSNTFGPYGELGLQAVILEVGQSYEESTSELTLVLPAWGTGRHAPRNGELVLAKLEATGFSSGTKYTPYIHKDGKTEDFTDTAAFLKHLLGMSPRTGVGTALMGSSIGQVIGFPGAEDYLAAKLPDLGDYFAALAEKLSTPHEH